MNRGKVNRYYRNRRNQISRPCLRCFQMGHSHKTCCTTGINSEAKIACGRCFRMNFFTVDCPCDSKNQNRHFTDGMTLRLSNGNLPRIYIDVLFGDSTFAALINTGIVLSRINYNALEIINSQRRADNLPEIQYPSIVNHTIRRRQKEFSLSFEICPDQAEMIVLGMNFLLKSGFSLTVDSVQINHRSPSTSSPDTVDFLYNHQQGTNIRRWLLAINRPLFNSYHRGSNPTLQNGMPVEIRNEYCEDPKNEEILEIHPDEDDMRLLED